MRKCFRLLRTVTLFVTLLSCQVSLFAQGSCACEDFIYLNDETQGITHKFTINPTALTEIDGDPGTAGTQPWVDFANFSFAGRQSPHGLASDLNGFLYIGNTFTGNAPEDGIYRFDCDGNFDPATQNGTGGAFPTPYLRTDAQPGGFQNGASTGTNFLNYDNFLVHNLRAEGVIVISQFCDASGDPDFDVGRVVLPEENDIFEQWGLGQGADGLFYATATTNSLTLLIYRADPSNFNFTGTNTLAPGIDVTNIILAEFQANNVGADPTTFDMTLQGIDADAAGNVYVFVNTAFGGNDVESGVFKLNPTLTTVLASDIFRNDVDNQPGAGRGLVFDDNFNRIYVSGGQSLNNGTSRPDCISTYDTDLNYQASLSVPFVTGQQPKGIALATECCPLNPTAAIDTSICNPVVGATIFLQDFVGCEGAVCATTFAPGVNNTGVMFDPCNNTVTVTDPANVCAEFTVTSASSSCSNLNLVLTIEGAIPVMATVAGDQTVCSGDAPAELTATAAGASSFQWQISTVSATDGFTPIAGATSATYQPGAVSQTTYFRVVTTADGACPGLTAFCAETSAAVTVSVIDAPSATIGTTDATCSGAALNMNAAVIVSNITSADRVGISTGTTYTGPDYATIGTNNATDGSESFSGLAANTAYTVRGFNGSDGCFVDFMIMTNDVVCTQPCSITGSITNQVCSNNGTNNNAGDDTYAITVTATIMNGVSTTYEVFDGTSVVATGTSGNPATFNTPADDGTETYTFRVQGDATCTTTGQTTQTLSPCSTPDPCSITGSIVSQTCSDNSTPANEADDSYTIVVNATLMNGTGTTYQVLVDGTPVTTTPAAPTSGTDATITVPATAGPSTTTITFRDADDATCVSPGVTTGDLMECSTPNQPCSVGGTFAIVSCSDNNTGSDDTDDFYTISVDATATNGSTTFEVIDVDNQVVVTGTYGTQATFTTAADGMTESYRIRDAADNTCISNGVTTPNLVSCSTPDPCAITAITSIPGTCDLATNTYSIDVQVTYENAPTGTLTVTADGVTETVAQTGSPQTVTLTGLFSDGMPHDVTATFTDDPDCTLTETDSYQAPDNCGGAATCAIEFAAIAATSCDAATNTFALTLAIDYVDGPATGDFEYRIDGGPFVTAMRNNFSTSGTNDTIALEGLDCDTDLPKMIEVRFEDQPGCSREVVFFFSPIDPAGYIYCVEDGSIVPGGQVTVTPPPGGAFEFLELDGQVLDGSSGRYAFVAVGPPGLPVVDGEYQISYTGPNGESPLANPATFGDGNDVLDPTAGSADNPNGDDPLEVGSDVRGGGLQLQNFSLAANPYFTRFDLAGGDPFIDLNNLPLDCDRCDVSINAGLDVICSFDAATGDNSFTLTGLRVTTFDEPAGEDLVVTFNGTELARMAPDPSGTTTFADFPLTDTVGFSYPLEVRFASTTTCGTSTPIDLIACTPDCADAPTSVGGNVFVDGDFNGEDAGAGAGEAGQGNVLVEVYDCEGDLVCSVYTNETGGWSCDGLTAGEEYRVEFSTPLNPFLVEAFAGPDNGTGVQFVTSGSCEVDYGVVDAEFQCRDQVVILTLPCYEGGDYSGFNSDNPAAISFGADASGGGNPPDTDATLSDLGATWGGAYNQRTGQLYFSSVLKRHSGFADGPGYLYQIDYSSGTDGTFVAGYNLDGVTPANRPGRPLDFGSVCRDAACATAPGNTGIASDYVLPSDPTVASVDLDAFAKIGTVSYGDIEYDFGTDLVWAVNLNERSLISIADAGDGSPGEVNAYDILGAPGLPQCNEGEIRPWALHFNKGVGYLGVVCDASDSQDFNDLTAFVLSFDPARVENGFAVELEVDVQETNRGRFVNNSLAIIGTMLPWVEDINQFPAPYLRNLANQPDDVAPVLRAGQPVLSDIGFTPAGDLIVGILDRTTFQLGAEQYTPESGSTQLTATFNYGDIFYYCRNADGTYRKEGSGNGCVPPNLPPNGTNDVQFGAYNFGGDYFNLNGGDNSRDYAQGAFLVLPETGEIVYTVTDPFPPELTFPVDDVTPYLRSQGVHWNSLSTGDRVDWYRIVEANSGDAQYYGKGTGLGDLVSICSDPQLQIGNYAWIDTNNDGIQQACEEPIAMLPVALFDGEGNLIASTVTDANGNYYFSSQSADDPNLRWVGSGADTALIANEDYTIVFGTDGAGNNTFDPAAMLLSVGDDVYSPTVSNTGEGTRPDANDSDVTPGTLAGYEGFPTISVMLGTETDHTFDAGFAPPCPFVDLVDEGPSVCVTGEVVLSVLVDSILLTNGFEYEWSTSGTGGFLDAAGVATTDYATAVTYVPSAADGAAGSVGLTLTSTAATTSEFCDTAADTVTVTVLNVDCGEFFWDGGE